MFRPRHVFVIFALGAVAVAGLVGCEEGSAQQAADRLSHRLPRPALPEPTAEVMEEPRCPPKMIKVAPAGRAPYCVDQYEAVLVDTTERRRIPPTYGPSSKLALVSERIWRSKRLELGSERARATPLPTLPAWMRKPFEPMATVKRGERPNGHVTGKLAKIACRNAQKRLCSYEEWHVACRGERDLPFPYGPKYVQWACNVFREAHPAAELHDDPSIGHSDPRLNLVKGSKGRLLRRGGETKDCGSRWPDGIIYDMVGNVDEWVEDPDGRFAGGFYGRSTRDGCEWNSKAHPAYYGDYSTGVRCCADLPVSR